MSSLTTRREVLAAPLMAAFYAQAARAAGVDPAMTVIAPPDSIAWRTPEGFPAVASATAELFGKPTQPGQYLVLIRWNPGFMSAPHWYDADRLCVVLSGTWWCASGADFAPDATVPVKAGSFVRRVARTPHYDGAKRTDGEPAVIALTGIGPAPIHLCDPGKPSWRAV